MEKVILITGSSRGIGEAAAAEFLKQGNKVAIFCRHQEDVSEAAIRLAEFGETKNILPLVGDVRKQEDVHRITQECIAAFGRIDILINNAGYVVWKPIEETTIAEYDETLDTNLKGPFLFMKEVLPFMKQADSGIIINISSGLGAAGQSKYSAYCASKFGINGLTEAMADELAETGIKVYSVLPGATATKLHMGIHPWEKPDEMMTPAHVAKKIVAISTGKKRTGSLFEVYS